MSCYATHRCGNQRELPTAGPLSVARGGGCPLTALHVQGSNNYAIVFQLLAPWILTHCTAWEKQVFDLSGG